MRYIFRNINRLIAAITLITFTSCSEVFDDVWQASLTERSLSLSNSSLNFTSEAQSKNINVKAENIVWTFQNNAQWLFFSPMSGKSSAVVNASVTENMTDTARTSYVLLNSTDADFPSSYNLTVSQSAPVPFIEFSEDNLIFDGCSSEQRVSVNSNRAWTYSASESWISISRNGNSLTISVSANDDSGAREGYVNVAAGNINKHILITQRAANVTSTIMSLTIGTLASTQSVVINSEASWTAECAQSWIDISPKSGKAGETTMYVSVTDNNDVIKRTGFIYIYIGNSRKLEISVVQDATQLTISPSELNFPAEASSQQVEVTSNTSWSLSSSESWIHLGRNNGSGNATISVSVDKNSNRQRVGTIDLLDKLGNRVNFVTVKQDASNFVVMPSELTFSIKGGTKSLYIQCDEEWSVSSGDSWISLSQEQGRGNGEVEVSVSQNKTNDIRHGYVSVYDASGTLIYNVSITQTSSSILVTPSEIQFSPDGSSSQLHVTADDAWSLSSPDWVVLDQTEGTDNADITISAEANFSSVERNGKINVMNSSGVTVQTIQISQPAIQISIEPDTYTLSPSKEEKTVRVTSNVAWTASSSKSWLTLNRTNGDGDANIVITAKENTSSSQRTAIVTFSSAVGNKTYAKLEVMQDAASSSVSPAALSFSVDGGTEELTITSNVNWRLDSSLSWISISPDSGTGSTRVSVAAEKNQSSNGRSGFISLKNSYGETIQDIRISQAGTAASAYPSSIHFTNVEGDQQQISISSNSSWTLTTTADWIELNITSGNGNGEVNVSTTVNNSGSERSAEILLKNGAGETLQTIIVTQDSYMLSVSDTSINFNSSSSSETVSIQSNYNWTASVDALWVTLSRTSGYGDSSFKVSVREHTGDAPRSAEIEVKCGNITKTIHITQNCNISLSCTPKSLSFPVDGGDADLKIQSNSSWSLTCTETWLTIDNKSGKNDATVHVKASASTNKSVRTANILLKNANGETVQTIDVTQTALNLSATLSTTEFEHTGGTATLTITSNSNWSFTTPDWISCDIHQGTGNKSINLTIDDNTTKVQRSGNIIISDASGSEAYKITVNQKAEPETQEYTRDLGHVFASKGGTLSVTSFETDIDWSADVVDGSDWITLLPTRGKATDELFIRTEDNPSGDKRTGKIQITYGYNRYTCLVEQYGKTIEITPSGPIDFFAKGGTSGSISITADVNASVAQTVDWVTISKNGNTFTVTAQKNNSAEARSTKLTIYLPGIINSPTQTIEVRQAGISSSFIFEGYEEDEKWN